MNSTLDYCDVFFGWAIDNFDLIGDLGSVGVEELLPGLGISKVEIHEDWVVRLLNIDPNVVASNNSMNLPKRADGVGQTHI